VFTRKIEDHLSKLSSEFREGRGVGEFLSREPKERSSWRWWRWRLAIVVESSSASFFISLCVLLNAVFVALHADRKINESTYNALLAPFLTIFNIEIILKLLALGFKLYLSDIYNRFDFVIILASDIDVFILWVNWNVDGSRVLSILRLFRILRLVRVMSKLRRMELIIDAFMNGMKEVVWILMIATLVLFMGGGHPHLLARRARGPARGDQGEVVHQRADQHAYTAPGDDAGVGRDRDHHREISPRELHLLRRLSHPVRAGHDGPLRGRLR